MSVRCGYCGNRHSGLQEVRVCAEANEMLRRRLKNRRPTTPEVEVMMGKARLNMERIHELRGVEVDQQINEAGLERARVALRAGRSARSSARCA